MNYVSEGRTGSIALAGVFVASRNPLVRLTTQNRLDMHTSPHCWVRPLWHHLVPSTTTITPLLFHLLSGLVQGLRPSLKLGRGGQLVGTNRSTLVNHSLFPLCRLV